MVSAVRHEESHSPIAVFNDLHYLIEIEVTVAFGFEELHRTRYSISMRDRRRDNILERVDQSAEEKPMGKWNVTAVAACCLMALAPAHAQEKKTASLTAPSLTAMDYIEIQQLVYKYGQDIDTCTNNGYDYADLYTTDGVFIDKYSDDGFKKGGVQRAKGRDELAAASWGGSKGCKDMPWNGWSHVMTNLVITPTAGGAKGRCYLIMLGEKGPGSVDRDGGYEDLYVKTAKGWRIKSRTHVRSKEWSNPLLQTADRK